MIFCDPNFTLFSSIAWAAFEYVCMREQTTNAWAGSSREAECQRSKERKGTPKSEKVRADDVSPLLSFGHNRGIRDIRQISDRLKSQCV